MRIAQICNTYYPSIGGIELHVREISKRLASRGYDVEILTTDPSGKLPTQELIDNVDVKRFKSWAPGEAYYFSKDLKRYLINKSEEFEIVHAHNYHALPALYAAEAKRKNKFVFTSHYSAKGSTPLRTLLHIPYRCVAKKIIERADAIICVSNWERQLLIKNFSEASTKSRLIPNGVDLNEFRKARRDNSQVHVRQRKILYLGRLVKIKGVQYLIKAMPHLENDIELEIVGDGPYHSALLNLVKRLGVEDRVTFSGPILSREKVVEKYVNADVFVSLCPTESYAISVAEALAARVPCVVANSYALTEWIDNKNCFGVNYPISIGELVATIRRTIGKEVEEPRLFDWDDVTEALIRTYSLVVAK